MKATGYDGVWGVEILSEHYRKLPLAEIAKIAFESAMAQFEPQWMFPGGYEEHLLRNR